MHSNILNKNKLKLFNTANSDLAGRISILENNVYKVTYYEIISGASGTITIPTAATINSNEFSGANCVLSEIDVNNKPTWVSPKDAGGTVVTATLNTGTGAWVKSGVTVSANVALIYSLNIKAIDYLNLNNFYIVDETVLGSLSYVLNNTSNNSVASSLLSAAISDETGSGSLVFGTSPTFTTDITTPKINGVTNALTINAATTLLDEMYLGTSASRGIWSWNASTVILRSGSSAVDFTIGTPAYTKNIVSYNATGNVAIGGVADNATDQLQVSNHIGTPVLNLRGRSGAAPTQLNFIPFDATNSIITFKNTSGTTRGFIDLNISSGEMKMWGSTGGYYVSIGANNAAVATFNINTTTFTQNSASSGAVTPFTFTNPANTGQTASTEISNFKVNGATKTWLAGAITNQRWNYFTANTAAFASASTITNSYGLYVEKATAGSNATITNNWAAGFSGNIQVITGSVANQGIVIRDYTGASTYGAVYMGVTPSNTNYTLACDGSITQLNAPSNSVYLSVANNALFGIRGNVTSGSTSCYTVLMPTSTGLTASTEMVSFAVGASSVQYQTGAITTQRSYNFSSVTYSFVGPSTITNAYGLYVNAPTAGTNATITNNYAAGFNARILSESTSVNVGLVLSRSTVSGFFQADSGAVLMGTGSAHNTEVYYNGTKNFTIGAAFTFTDGVNMVVGSTNGTKIGTANTQKLAFWNATPIVQPTTAVTAATFVANTSGIVNDTATFDGYTIGQVVKALRNTGLLA